MDVVDELVVKSSTAKSDKVDSAILCRFFSCDDKRWNVLAEAASSLYHDIAADMAELVTKNFSTYYRIIINGYLASKLGRVPYYTTATNHAVMRDVHIFHQKIV